MHVPKENPTHTSLSPGVPLCPGPHNLTEEVDSSIEPQTCVDITYEVFVSALMSHTAHTNIKKHTLKLLLHDYGPQSDNEEHWFTHTSTHKSAHGYTIR